MSTPEPPRPAAGNSAGPTDAGLSRAGAGHDDDRGHTRNPLT